MKTRILLADDHTILRTGLRDLLNGCTDLHVVAEARNGRDALQQVDALRPDVVLMDVTMPDLNGVEATRQITRDWPETKILCLTMHDTLKCASEILLAGAHGYVVKDGDINELITAVRTVARGQFYLSPEITKLIIKDYVRLAKSCHSSAEDLSPREREILQLLAEGYPSSEIASKLYVSTKTIATHRQNIMTKIHVDNMADLTKFALRQGVISAD